MRVLIACEHSGIVRDAFKRRGHEAWSCDLLPTERPGLHYQGDVFDILKEKWDLLIAHPPCTHLAISGALWFHLKEKEQREAINFARRLIFAPIPKVVVENPMGILSTRVAKYSQVIHPWMFGHDKAKTTCLWLRGVPKLQPTKIIPPRGYQLVTAKIDCVQEDGTLWCPVHDHSYPECGCIGPYKEGYAYKKIHGFEFAMKRPALPLRWSNQTQIDGADKTSQSPKRWKIRSRTSIGVATAMANQWG